MKQGLGLSPLPQGRTTLHLFALSRTLRIRQEHGLGFSTEKSISPLRAIEDYCSALTNFHMFSRATGPTRQERRTNDIDPASSGTLIDWCAPGTQ